MLLILCAKLLPSGACGMNHAEKSEERACLRTSSLFVPAALLDVDLLREKTKRAVAPLLSWTVLRYQGETHPMGVFRGERAQRWGAWGRRGIIQQGKIAAENGRETRHVKRRRAANTEGCARIMDIAQESLRLHEQWQGKLDTVPKMKIETREDLALAYTPGVAEPCRKIAANPEDAYKYTMKANTVAVVSDGSAVLGLGNIGPAAAMPVMEGKCALFKAFGGVNAVPLCLDTQDVDEIVETVKRIAPSFGGINLEDISAPRCFEIERRLIDELDIPVFHDDQHGTAIVVLSGVINALRLTGKKKEDCRVVVNGAGSAGIAIAKLLLNYGFRNLILCDKCGIINSLSEGINEAQRAMLATTNLNDEQGSLADAMRGADIFVGVSAPGIVSADMVKSMNDDAILFAMANPTPEIFPRRGSRGRRARGGHGPLGLSEPDQQRGGVPRHFQGRP